MGLCDVFCLTCVAPHDIEPDRLGRIWHSRRMVYTKEVIAFALEDNDILIDDIPLEGVESIQTVSLQDSNSFLAGGIEEEVKNVFQIKTTLDGHNSVSQRNHILLRCAL